MINRLPVDCTIIEVLPETENPWDDAVATGRAVVRKVADNIAHCVVTWGVIRRHDKLRVIREGIRLQTAPLFLMQLQRIGKEVAEVAEGVPCDLRLVDFDGLKNGDVVEAISENRAESP